MDLVEHTHKSPRILRPREVIWLVKKLYNPSPQLPRVLYSGSYSFSCSCAASPLEIIMKVLPVCDKIFMFHPLIFSLVDRHLARSAAFLSTF